MIQRSIASRYAKVLFALEDGELEQRLNDCDSFNQLLKTFPQLLKVLKAPQISVEEKKTTLKTILKDRYPIKFMNFIFYLIEKNRLDLLAAIATEFRSLVNKSLNVWEADMKTAVPIRLEIEEDLKKKLENLYCKKMKIHQTIDPKMIGGAILVIGNEMIDWSVRGRLKKMKEYLKS